MEWKLFQAGTSGNTNPLTEVTDSGVVINVNTPAQSNLGCYERNEDVSGRNSSNMKQLGNLGRQTLQHISFICPRRV